jgi:hypothetical protein
MKGFSMGSNHYPAAELSDEAWVEAVRTDPNPSIDLDPTSPIARALSRKGREYETRMQHNRDAAVKTRFASRRLKSYVVDRVLQAGRVELAPLLTTMRESGVFEEPLLRQGLHDAICWRRFGETRRESFHVTDDELAVEAAARTRNAFLVIKSYTEGREHLIHGGTNLPLAE